MDKANEIIANTDNAISADQFGNPANPAIHRETTAKEILADTGNKVDIFVAGFGTAGTVSGVGEVLKDVNADTQVIAVEPANSPLLSQGRAGSHKIQGIGANFIPEVMDRKVIDEFRTVTNEDAISTARKLATDEGILGGISSGGNVFVALEEAKKPENKGKTIVTVITDYGERYVSTVLFEDIRSEWS